MDGTSPDRLKGRDYERELAKLHVELVKLQEWVKQTGRKICVVFEGRDGAGKGGTIKAITERVSPRVFRVIALPAPTEREKSQMYIQRYVPHLPAAGEVVIFDRSWYNRAGVERVMGFCTEEQATRFLALVPGVEKAMVESGIILIKYWLEVSQDEQTRRLESHRRWTEDLEALADGSRILQPLVRLFPRTGRDDCRERHIMGALVCRSIRRQEARPPECHQSHAQQNPVRGSPQGEGEASQAQSCGRLQGTRLSAEICPGTELVIRSDITRPTRVPPQSHSVGANRS